MRINCIERVLVATPSLEEARQRWTRAGFAIAPEDVYAAGMKIARCAAGAVEIDLCSAIGDESNPLADAIAEAAAHGGGIVGWVWGVDPSAEQSGAAIALPASRATVEARILEPSLPGVLTMALKVGTDQSSRRELYRAAFGENLNSVDFLEHIVVMAPSLEDAIASQEAIGIPCKRIREAGAGMRQAFFKLEQTVIEVVAPARGRAGCWGLAFMCGDIAKAVSIARTNGLQATEPKKAIQGGMIARIVDPLDGVAVAFMQAP